MRGSRWGLIGLCVAAFGGAGPAHAAVLTLGSGDQPELAFAADGTAHVVFNAPNRTLVRYCRLAAAADACTPAQELAQDQTGLSRPHVFVDGATVRIATNRCCGGGSRTLLFTSGDAGLTFGGAVTIGDLDPSGDTVAGPGNAISGVTRSSSSLFFQRMPADSPAAATNAAISAQYRYNGTVGLHDGRPVVASDDGTTTAFSINNGADPNNAANWSASKVVGPGAFSLLAGGPSGLFLLTWANKTHEVRRFDGTDFGPPTALPAENALAAGQFHQDASGTLHAVWPQAGAGGVDLVHSRSADGKVWSEPGIIATGSGFTELRIAAGPDGKGLAVWEQGVGEASTIEAARFPVAGAGEAPVARFSWTPPTPCTDARIGLNAGESTGGDPIVRWRWTVDRYSELQPTHRFTSTGASASLYVPAFSQRTRWDTLLQSRGYYIDRERPPVTVTLTVTDAAGRSASVSRAIAFRYPKDSIFIRTGPLAAFFGGSGGAQSACESRLIGPPTMKFAGAAATVRGSTAALSLRCPPGSHNCLGVATVRALAGRSGRAAPAATRRPPGTARAFDIPPGRRLTLPVTLKGRDAALLRGRRATRVRAVVTFVSKGGRGRQFTRTLRVKYRAG